MEPERSSTRRREEDLTLVCEDFSVFQRRLKDARLVDDRLVYAINTNVPTESFISTENADDQCHKLQQQILQAQADRRWLITSCIRIAEASVSRLKAADSKSSTSSHVSASVRKEMSKVRMMQSELNVEDVLEDRAEKVLHDRCRIPYGTRGS
ncbi:hypothetical protein RvY_09094 [Ramazzottius varieornatus]|uniref:Protein MIX23 n=1 Tax=Ramazzottius varieornatus TaxID=947166 RepID=A0A1D1VHB2_RAMVA|nr:hypothetical protein RvY_09094 [Ramazzottius varieornatus]